jgi:hypothetical protein
MRIIVTKNGIEIVEELDEMEKSNSLTSKLNKKKNFISHFRRNTSLNIKNRNYSNLFNQKKLKHKFSSPFDFDIQNIPQSELKKAKELKLSTTKISFPKSFAHIYEDNNDTSSNIIDSNFQLPSLINSKSDFLNNNESNISLNSKFYSFNDIIPKNKVNKMKINLINNRRMKDRLSRIDENKFRSIYFPKTELENFEDVLNYQIINPNKVSLIKYLNESKNLQPLALKELINSNPHRLNRMNKMCEIILRKEDKNQLMKEDIKKKLKNEFNDEVIKCQKKIDSMKNDIKEFKETMDKYNIKKVDHKENYKDLLHMMETKVWSKYDFERLNKKSTPKSKNEYFFNQNSLNFENKNNDFQTNIFNKII